MPGKTIRIYLTDGLPDGLRTAEIGNWTGKAIVAPRIDLPALAKRQETRRTGVHFLVGDDPENPSQDAVYIGEGDDVPNRLASHDKDETRDFWTNTVVVVSKDENLTKAHVRYLESRLIQMTRAAGRARLTNGTSPPSPPLPEPDVADMEHFLGEICVLLPALGFTFLRPAPSFEAIAHAEDAQPRFVMDEVGIKATAVESDEGFIVAKGSTARKAGVPSWSRSRAPRPASRTGSLDGLF